MPATVVIPLPALDHDPSEVAISWQVLTSAGHRVVFATPEGRPAEADPRMLTGQGLDLWSAVPGLRRLPLLGLALRADARARRAHRAMRETPAFQQPLRHDALDARAFDALLLPGGHWARGMRGYLEDARLHAFVAAFFDADKPVAAICHGTVLAARSRSARSGRSVLHGRRTTGLTWSLERSAWRLMRFAGRVWEPHYYRTYLEQPGEPAGWRSVQAEVTRALARPEDFLDVPGRCAAALAAGERPVARHARRRPPGLRRARRPLRLGALARRRSHVRAPLRRRARRPLTRQGRLRPTMLAA